MSDPKTIVTPEAILSYPSLFTPRAGPDGGEPKYSCVLVFPEGTDLSGLQQAVMAAGRERWGDKFPGMVKSGSLYVPFRKDWEEKGYPENSVFLSCRSKAQPGLVDRQVNPILDPGQLYAGCIVRAQLRAFAFSNVKKGVSFGLNNLQKIRDGERLDGRLPAERVFDAVEGEDEGDGQETGGSGLFDEGDLGSLMG